MQFRIGQMVAKCPHCGGAEFKLPANERSGPHMNYLCASCGWPVQYAKLIAQIGREAQRHRRERLSSTGSLHVREVRTAPNSLLVKPVHGVADRDAEVSAAVAGGNFAAVSSVGVQSSRKK